ncbi:MAG TPA: hypothetical protein PLL73_05765, partial [Syntrophorhabdaceae bacterium]|nr:hypothetical protein [Syntrophorhabdaceae bacterium]HPH41943.1 hypothetical protein [Syntrophorhabdaceae bacterium]
DRLDAGGVSISNALFGLTASVNTFQTLISNAVHLEHSNLQNQGVHQKTAQTVSISGRNTKKP